MPEIIMSNIKTDFLSSLRKSNPTQEVAAQSSPLFHSFQFISFDIPPHVLAVFFPFLALFFFRLFIQVLPENPSSLKFPILRTHLFCFLSLKAPSVRMLHRFPVQKPFFGLLAAVLLIPTFALFKTVFQKPITSFFHFPEGMGSIDFDSVKLEKANAMRMYHALRKFANFLRVLEVFVALFIMLLLSSKPVSEPVRIFAEYLRQLCVVLANPRFVFVFGNAIIITLFVKSGHFSGVNPDGSNQAPDLYKEYVHHSENCQKVVSQTDDNDDFVKHSESHQSGFTAIDSPIPATSEDKQIVCWENAHPTVLPDPVTTVTKKVEEMKFYRRTKSAPVRAEIVEKPSRALRRSETDKFLDCSVGKPQRRLSTVDELSNEEFRRMVEAFIEKQQRLLRAE